MKVTVCEINKPFPLQESWTNLVEHVQKNKSEFVLLPEMPFYSWICKTKKPDKNKWLDSVRAHDEWIGRIKELGAKTVIGSRPVIQNNINYQEGFIWEEKSGYKACHKKVYLPNVEGYYEAEWYKQGPFDFSVYEVNGIKIGFAICTELWFMSHIKDYGKMGMHILVCPRSTSLSTRAKWLSGGTAASVISGAYTLSSNFSEIEDKDSFAGPGWITEPEDGNIIATTSEQIPFATLDIDPKIADQAKSTYPRNI